MYFVFEYSFRNANNEFLLPLKENAIELQQKIN